MSLTLKPTEPEKLAEIILQLAKNTQAGIVLMAVALLDNSLQLLLLTAMRPLSNKVADAILGDRGPLYETAPKANVAFGFQLIDEETFRALKALTNIRNKFAHMRAQLTFESTVILDACHALPGWNKDCDPFKLFTDTAEECAKAIDAKMDELTLKDAMRPDASQDR